MTTADRVRARLRQPAFVRVAATVISDPRRALRDTGLTVAGSDAMLGPELAANTLVEVIADEAAAVAQADADQHEPDRIGGHAVKGRKVADQPFERRAELILGIAGDGRVRELGPRLGAERGDRVA